MNRLESWKEAYEPNKTFNKHIQPIRIKKGNIWTKQNIQQTHSTD